MLRQSFFCAYLLLFISFLTCPHEIYFFLFFCIFFFSYPPTVLGVFYTVHLRASRAGDRVLAYDLLCLLDWDRFGVQGFYASSQLLRFLHELCIYASLCLHCAFLPRMDQTRKAPHLFYYHTNYNIDFNLMYVHIL